MTARVRAVHRRGGHSFSKDSVAEVTLLPGLGVEGDGHLGARVQHRSRVARDPDQPNLRQVHLLHAELFAELTEKGFTVGPGDIGENITTEGLDILSLPTGTLLRIGDRALVALTGLRNPCSQLDAFQAGLMEACLDRSGTELRRKAGVMGVVVEGGTVRPGDPILTLSPPGKPMPLARV